jgi:hypothetical protein
VRKRLGDGETAAAGIQLVAEETDGDVACGVGRLAEARDRRIEAEAVVPRISSARAIGSVIGSPWPGSATRGLSSIVQRSKAR